MSFKIRILKPLTWTDMAGVVRDELREGDVIDATCELTQYGHFVTAYGGICLDEAERVE